MKSLIVFVLIISFLLSSCYSRGFEYLSNKVAIEVINNSTASIEKISITYGDKYYADLKFQDGGLKVLIIPYNGELLTIEIQLNNIVNNNLTREQEIYVYSLPLETNQLLITDDFKIISKTIRNDKKRINDYIDMISKSLLSR